MISRLVSLDHPYAIKPSMVFALETYWPSSDGWSAAANRPIRLIGGAIEIVAALVCAVIDSFTLLAIACFAQGLARLALTTCRSAYLAGQLPTNRLNVGMGSNVLSIGLAMAPQWRLAQRCLAWLWSARRLHRRLMA